MSTATQESRKAGMCAGFCSLAASGSTAGESTVSEWAARSIADRLCVLGRVRRAMAAQAEAFADAIAPELPRSKADTIVTELLPLLDACKFLERNAANILATRKLGSAGRPLWLRGVQAEIYREPLGHVLVIGPANFPLFLPGAQVLQALAAGNTVTWKPGKGGRAVALLMAEALYRAGVPEHALRITGDSVVDAEQALASGPDKVIFTGSAASGESILRTLAATATPAVVELSGADAVVVMPGADLAQTAKALAFGLRLNGGQVCMSPRRLFAPSATMALLKPLLERELAAVPAVALSEKTAEQLAELVNDARSRGAKICGDVDPKAQKPLIIENTSVAMKVTCADVFAPVLSLISLNSLLELPEAYGACPYALTLAIFCSRGEEKLARGFAKLLRAGAVLINDLIAPTADPRVPFGGRGASGYGATRGAEGLLEMTAGKTVLVRRGGTMRHLESTTDADAPLLSSLVRVLHGSWSARLQALRDLSFTSKSKQE